MEENEILECHICNKSLDELIDDYFVCKFCNEVTCKEHLANTCTECCDLDDDGNIDYDGHVQVCFICVNCYETE